MAAGLALYRVHAELAPALWPWVWELIEKRYGGPLPEAWLERAAGVVAVEAIRRGVEPVAEPIARAERRGRRVVITAELLAWGPDGLAADQKIKLVDVVDQVRNEGEQ